MRSFVVVLAVGWIALAVACGSSSSSTPVDASHDGPPDATDAPITCSGGAPCLTLIAGDNRTGSADGTGVAALFDGPGQVAVDGSGNVYVADTGNSVIREVTAAGVVTTLAGSAGTPGSTDGSGSAARFNSPTGVTVDGSGNVYVADTVNCTIREITPAGVVTTLAGSAGTAGSADGSAADARFANPAALTVDGSGNVYVADTDNSTIRKVALGGVVSTLAGSAGNVGSANGSGSAASFYHPLGVAVDGSGNVYVADNSAIRVVTSAGVVTTLAGVAGTLGSANGSGSAALFDVPQGLAVDGSGNIYVADHDNNLIRMITPAGVVTTLAGTVGSERVVLGTSPELGFPGYLAVSGSGLAISDQDDILLLENAVQ